MSTENRFGIDAKAYYGAAGSTPSTELAEAYKVTLKIDLESGNFNSRASNWKISDVAMLDADVEITIANSLRNATAIGFFWSAMTTRTAVALKVLDAETSSRGIDADWVITGCNNDQDNTAAQEWVFTFKPSYTTSGGRYPAAVTA